MKAGILMTLASVALGRPSGSAEDDASIQRNGTVSQDDYDNLVFYSQHAAAAYCNADKKGSQSVQCDGSCPKVEANGALIVDSFVGSRTGVGAYVAVDQARHEIVLAVRGSNNIRNLFTTLFFSWKDCAPLVAECQVHAGFASGWAEIADAASAAVAAARSDHAGFGLVVAGHSLGGAVATLAAAYLRRAGHPAGLYTYGAPRVGNEAFASFVSSQPGGRQWRVTHRDDLVPRLPPIFLGFRHVSPEYWLVGGTSTQDSYPLDSIRLCYGIANVDCNAHSHVFNWDAHLHYLGRISDCAPSSFQWKRSADNVSNEVPDDPYDDDFKQRLRYWARMDDEFVKYTNYYGYT